MAQSENAASDNARTVSVHPILQAVLGDGASLPKTLCGYVGPSGRDGYLTVYPNLTALEKSYEVAVADILHTADVPETFRPFGAQVIWLRSDAYVAFRNVTVGGSAQSTPAAQPVQAKEMVNVQEGRLRMQRPLEVMGVHCTCSPCVNCMSHCDDSCVSGNCAVYPVME